MLTTTTTSESDKASPLDAAGGGTRDRVRSLLAGFFARRGSSHVASLDLMRAIAVLGVFALHLQVAALNMGVNIPLANYGELGVSLFFVLSGYFIGFSVLSPGSFDGFDYSRRRAARILPAYWFSMMVVIFLLRADTLMTKTGLEDVATHVLLIHGFFPEFRVSINPVWWTLSVEWFFYIFMLLIAGVWRRRVGGYVVVVLMVVGCVAYRSMVWATFGDEPGDVNNWVKQLPGTADFFAGGMLIALLVQQARIREFVARAEVRAIGLTLGIVVIVGSMWVYGRQPGDAYFNSYRHVVWWPLTFAAGSALVILFVQQFEHSIGRVARYSGLAFIGTISYSVYLFHLTIIGAFNRAWVNVQPDVSPWLILGMSFVATLIFATVSYQFIERPFMTMSHKARGNKRGGFRQDRPGDDMSPDADGRLPDPVTVAD